MTIRRIDLFLSGLFILLSGFPVRAQHFDPAHRHAIEITSGIPPLRSWLMMPGLDARMTNRQSVQDECRWAVNAGYAYALNERWEINAILNYTSSKYTLVQKAESGETVSLDKRKAETFSLMADVRWKWVRGENHSFYSALGIGVPIAPHTIVTPYITPVGFRIGGKHLYGLVELNLSSAATYFLAGVGCRF